jgi:predicted PolB exonuclease-like 3'-5' exonuclease
MQVVSIDIETALDAKAVQRCGFTPSDEFAPFPLHEIVCASAFTVTRTRTGETLYAVESFSRGSMSERAIIASIEQAVVDATYVITYNGFAFDLPVLATRAMLHEVHVPRLVELRNRSRVGRHHDLFAEIKREAGPVSLRQLCAPFDIPVKPDLAARVSELVQAQEWRALEQYCETDAVACWLAFQFWERVGEPGLARAVWKEFAVWIKANHTNHPHLVAFARAIGAPGASIER